MQASISLDGSLLSPAARRVITVLQRQNQPVYLVGGCVRDLLLGRPTHDLDLTVERDALDLARQMADALGGAFVALDVDRDTGRAVLEDAGGQVLSVDCVAWRAGSLAEDLRLRDFTINALAVDVSRPEAGVIDVTGGLADLEARSLRLASDRAIVDDPLRGLRAVRLAAELASLGFRLEIDTAHEVARCAAMLATCAAERIRDELVRILDAAGPDNWLRLMGRLGQLAVILPEVEALRDVTQSPPHRWDVFEHTVRVVAGVAAQMDWLAGEAWRGGTVALDFSRALKPYRARLQAHFGQGEGAGLRNRGRMLRWAALGHDWGKPATRQVEIGPEDQKRVRYFGHETVGATLVAEALRRLRFNDREVRRAATVVAHHMRPANLATGGSTPSRRVVYRYFRDLGDAGVDVAMLSLADHLATYGPDAGLDEGKDLLAVVLRLLDDFFNRREETVAPELLVDGHDLMQSLGVPSGRLVGRMLAAIAEAQASGEVHTRQDALRLAARMVEPSSSAESSC